MKNRIRYSQNFIKDINLVTRLINQSLINKNDTVIEIGAGDGIITSILKNYARDVIAYEIDQNYFARLTNKFENIPNIHFEPGDFLRAPLPNFPYKVFSNVPFYMTADVMKKLFLSKTPPMDSFLILQREAALKYIGKPFDTKNSLQAVLIYPRFEIKITHEFNQNDFSPTPNVKIILINIKRRNSSLIEDADKENYYDFVAYAYGQYKPKLPGNVTQSELALDDWIKFFKEYAKTQTGKLKEIKGSYGKLVQQQRNLEKIHRTRVDKKWRNFSK